MLRDGKLTVVPKIEIDGLKKRELDFTSKIDNMEKLIRDKDIYIDELSKEILEIKKDRDNFQSELRNQETVINNLKSDIESLKSTNVELNKLKDGIINEKEAEIIELQEKIEDLALNSNLDKELIEELEHLRHKYNFSERQLIRKREDFIDLNSQYISLRQRHEHLEKEKNELSKLYIAEQELKRSYYQELQNLNEKLKLSFDPEGFSTYIHSTIDNFNAQVNKSDNSVNYVIGELDVDLKVELSKNKDDGGISFIAPKISAKGEETLSSLKFSIRAIPKELEN
ncbi:hypothetical protein [Natronospora cellulosivora (SeqCode)]